MITIIISLCIVAFIAIAVALYFYFKNPNNFDTPEKPAEKMPLTPEECLVNSAFKYLNYTSGKHYLSKTPAKFELVVYSVSILFYTTVKIDTEHHVFKNQFDIDNFDMRLKEAAIKKSKFFFPSMLDKHIESSFNNRYNFYKHIIQKEGMSYVNEELALIIKTALFTTCPFEYSLSSPLVVIDIMEDSAIQFETNSFIRQSRGNHNQDAEKFLQITINNIKQSACKLTALNDNSAGSRSDNEQHLHDLSQPKALTMQEIDSLCKNSDFSNIFDDVKNLLFKLSSDSKNIYDDSFHFKKGDNISEICYAIEAETFLFSIFCLYPFEFDLPKHLQTKKTNLAVHFFLEFYSMVSNDSYKLGNYSNPLISLRTKEYKDLLNNRIKPYNLLQSKNDIDDLLLNYYMHAMAQLFLNRTPMKTNDCVSPLKMNDKSLELNVSVFYGDILEYLNSDKYISIVHGLMNIMSAYDENDILFAYSILIFNNANKPKQCNNSISQYDDENIETPIDYEPSILPDLV